MATEAEIKAAIDSDITNQTTTNSVTQVNVGERMKDTVDYTVQEIATNAGNIATNTANISANASDIGTNVVGIIAVQSNLTNEIATVDSEIALCTKNADPDVSANNWVLDEDDMSSNSATKVPTQQSVKAYVDASSGGGTPDLDAVATVGNSTSQEIVSNVGFQAGGGATYASLWSAFLKFFNSTFKLEIFAPTLTDDRVITYPDADGEVALAVLEQSKQLFQSGTNDPSPQFPQIDTISVNSVFSSPTDFRDVDFERISVGLYSCKIRYTPATLPVDTSKVALMFGDAVCRITAKFAGVESTWSYVQYQFETYTPDGVLSDDQLLGNNGTFFNVKIYN